MNLSLRINEQLSYGSVPEDVYVFDRVGLLGVNDSEAVSLTLRVLGTANAVFDLANSYYRFGAEPYKKLVPDGADFRLDRPGLQDTIDVQFDLVLRWRPLTDFVGVTVDVEAEGSAKKKVSISPTGARIPRPSLHLALALDRSGSMSMPASLLESVDKATRLRNAVTSALALLAPNDRVYGTRFDDVVDPLFGPQGLQSSTAITNFPLVDLSPRGLTAIGNAVFSALDQLPAASSSETHALLLVTDGMENVSSPHTIRTPNPPNQPQTISGKVGEKGATVFGLGVGVGPNGNGSIDETAILSVVASTAGYLALTDVAYPNAADREFNLDKFLVQMVSDATKTPVLTDPTGEVGVASPVEIPFEVSELESSIDVIVLSNDPSRLLVEVIAPDKSSFTASSASPPAVRYTSGRATVFGFDLSRLWPGLATYAGRWRVRLDARPTDVAGKARAFGRPIAYSVVVRGRSAFQLEPTVVPLGARPGDEVRLFATVGGGAPLLDKAEVHVEAHYPDASKATVALKQTTPGRFTGTFVPDAFGIYSLRFLAAAKGPFGVLQREATRTHLVPRGAKPLAQEQPSRPTSGGAQPGGSTGTSQPSGDPTGGCGPTHGCRCACHTRCPCHDPR